MHRTVYLIYIQYDVPEDVAEPSVREYSTRWDTTEADVYPEHSRSTQSTGLQDRSQSANQTNREVSGVT